MSSQSPSLRERMRAGALQVRAQARQETALLLQGLKSSLDEVRESPARTAAQVAGLAGLLAVAQVALPEARTSAPVAGESTHTQQLDARLLQQHGAHSLHERLLASVRQAVEGEVYVLNPRLQQRLAEMEARSPTFARQLKEVRRSHFRLWVGTHEELGLERDDGVGGEIRYIEQGGRASGALFVINLPMLEERFLQEQTSEMRSVEERMLRGEEMATIAHEFAHIYDVAMNQGDLAFNCEDPERDVAAREELRSCVMQRENEFRRELGLPLAQAYGVPRREGTLLPYAIQSVRERLRIVERAPVPEAERGGAYTVDEVERLLQGGVSPGRILHLLEDDGRLFALTSDVRARLQRAGATDSLLLRLDSVPERASTGRPHSGGTPQPYGLSQLERLFRGGVREARIASLVAENGIAFRLDEQSRRQLQTAGASAELLDVLAQAEMRTLPSAESRSQEAVPTPRVGGVRR